LYVGILLAVVEQPGFLMLLIWFALCLGVLGLLQGLVRMAFVRCRKHLVVQTAGRLPPTSARPLPFLGTTLRRLMVYSGLFAVLVPLVLSGMLHLQMLRLKAPELPSGPNIPALGRADPGWKLETLDGQEVSFGRFHGTAVFLNVWATWCPPCVAEVPSIQALYDAVKDEGVAVVLVTAEPPETVRPFVAKKGWHVPVYIARGGVPAVFHTGAIPATFLLNRRGEVVYRHTGSADWNAEDCRGFLRRLQREP
jgi:thiol-disulfide isomerase/thioredoxin